MYVAKWMKTASRGGMLILALLGWGCDGSNDGVRGSGTIEFDEVDVGSLAGGRVVALFSDEGDVVESGDTLALLKEPEVEAAVSMRAAEVARAEAVWRDLVAGPRRQEIEAAVAEMEASGAELQSAESELKRVEGLFDAELISDLRVDQARAARDAALARRSAAEERLALLRAGYRTEQILAASRDVEAARARYDAAVDLADELVVRAPIAGVVLVRPVEPGELVAAGATLFTLGNPDSLWMRVYIPAPRIVAVKLGQTARVEVDGLPGRIFEGRVVEIATRAEFTPRAALTEEERANLVFGVKISLKPSGGVLKPGLPADATIEADQTEMAGDSLRATSL